MEGLIEKVILSRSGAFFLPMLRWFPWFFRSCHEKRGMSDRQFGWQLVVITALSAAGLWALLRIPALQPYQLIGWISLGGFALLCLLLYWAGKRAALSNNKNDFTSTVLGATVGKMFLAILIIFSYLQLAKPPDKLFVIPFFGEYLVFTVFEVYFMMRLGRMNV